MDNIFIGFDTFSKQVDNQNDENKPSEFNEGWWNREIEQPSSYSIPKTNHMDYNPAVGEALDRGRAEGKVREVVDPPDYPTQGEGFIDSTPWPDEATDAEGNPSERFYGGNNPEAKAFRRKIDHMWGIYHNPERCPECAKKQGDPAYGKTEPDTSWDEWEYATIENNESPYYRQGLEYEDWKKLKYPEGREERGADAWLLPQHQGEGNIYSPNRQDQGGTDISDVGIEEAGEHMQKQQDISFIKTLDSIIYSMEKK